jgi:hypothetical protein
MIGLGSDWVPELEEIPREGNKNINATHDPHPTFDEINPQSAQVD